MNTQAEQNFCKDLQHLVGAGLQIRLNDNRSTMLSVTWEPHQTRVSLHRIFLEAPTEVHQALASYLRGEDKSISSKIKKFIDERTPLLNYSHQLDPETLHSRGEQYDLQQIYEKLNMQYFQSRLSLSITWFGSPTPQNRSRCVLGLYYDLLKLVKIHRLLDNTSIPSYVIEYVVYHEMVHAICPGAVDAKGHHRVHTEEFKVREKMFSEYDLACRWIKQYQMNFFASQRTSLYGRTQQMGKYKASKKQGRCQKRKNFLSSI